MIQPDLAEGRLVQLSDIPVLEDFDYYLTQSQMTDRDAARRRARLLFLEWVEDQRSR